MWIYTPDLAYNTEQYKSIWADGQTPILRLDPGDGTYEDGITFDSVESSVKAFDAVMNGIAQGHNTLYLHEVPDGEVIRLVIEYDKTDYFTRINTKEECIIQDPREWINCPVIPAVPSVIKS